MLSILLATCVILTAPPTQTVANPATTAIETLRNVRTWQFQLQHLGLSELSQSPADMLVIDMSRDATIEGAFTRREIEALQKGPGGRRRLVIAYLSVGEAEDHRFYWRHYWPAAKPDWLLEENCRWETNFLVKYWSDEWKHNLFRGDDSLLAQIIHAGFDGIYLDRVDAYWDIRRRFPASRTEMIRLVSELRRKARAMKPDFLFIAQNAESLLEDRTYRTLIDAVAKEDLLFGLTGTGRRNTRSSIAWSLGMLRRLKAERKPVLVVEYLRSAEAIAGAERELRSLGLIPTFPTRLLDGRNPSAANVHSDVGTPEFARSNCQ